MKLWMKVYLVALPLALIVLTICSGQLLSSSFNDTRARERERALSDHAMLMAALTTHLESVERGYEHNQELRELALAAAARNYGKYYTSDDVVLSIRGLDGNRLFSGMTETQADAMNLSPEIGGGRHCVIRRVDQDYIMYVSGWTIAAGDWYLMDYARDITTVMQQVRQFARDAALLLALASVVLGAGLYVLINAAMRPLAQLSGGARRLQQGDYSARIKPSGGEVGELASAFNEMAGAVQLHIGQLERAAEDQRMFIANMAHEMKTPMTTILGYASLLRRANLPEGKREVALDAIMAEGTRLDALQHKLLTLQGLEGGLDLQDTPVLPLLRDACAGAEHATIRCTLTSWPLDRELFRCLITNLVDNAVKASPEGGKISVSAAPVGSGAIFEVSDSGHGIPPAELSRVLQPFYMVDKQRARSRNGAGLGLALCDAICKAHGATLEIDSQEGVGTTVRVRF